MNIPTTTKHAPFVVLFALAIIFAVPAISFAQGRGNGKGQGSNLDKKCAKFVNCHDARDGRVDGRGPAVNQTSNPVYQPPVYQPPVYQPPAGDVYSNRRNRDRDSDSQTNYPRSRNRRVRRHDNADNNQTATWRRRRNGSTDTETRNRRVHRSDRSNVID